MTMGTERNSSPQGLITLPRSPKTNKGTSTSDITHEAVAELMGSTPGNVDPPPTDGKNDADVSDCDEGDRTTGDQSDQAMPLNEGERCMLMSRRGRRSDGST